MLASIFAIQGYETLRRPEHVSPVAEPVVRPLAERVSAVPNDTEQAVRINGAVQLVAASLLAIGRLPRLSAMAIAATLVPTTVAGHRFWEAEDEQTRAQQRIHFLKNLSMFGGLLIATADTAGRPSLAWRSRHAGRDVSRVARAAKASGVTAAKTYAKTAGTTVKAPIKATKTPVKAAKLPAAMTAKLPAMTAKLQARAVKLQARTAKLPAKAAKLPVTVAQLQAKAAKLPVTTAKLLPAAAAAKLPVKAGKVTGKTSHKMSRLRSALHAS